MSHPLSIVGCIESAVLRKAIDQLQAFDLAALDSAQVLGLIDGLEREARRLRSLQLHVMGEADRRGAHRVDGHASAKVLVRHRCQLPGGEALGREKSMRALRELPEIAAAFAGGEIGSAQVDLIGRVHANPRVRYLMPQEQGRFLRWARNLSFRDFDLKMRQWERLADSDGPAPANERRHDNRDIKLIQDPIELGWTWSGWIACAQGTAMREIWHHYIDAELLADWEKARAEHGDQARGAHLPRTAAQRRADALWQLFQDAAKSEGWAVPVGWVHNIIWSADAYEEMLRRLDGAHPEPVEVDDYRCETIDGTPLEPLEAAAGSLVGRVRRVIVDAASEVIETGGRPERGPRQRRRRRSGRAPSAQPQPGKCRAAEGTCEIDHLSPHGIGGLTNPANGAPLCGRHNRWKQKGFRITRDPDGTHRTLRPDGTQLE